MHPEIYVETIHVKFSELLQIGIHLCDQELEPALLRFPDNHFLPPLITNVTDVLNG